jgi:hypothetical protein
MARFLTSTNATNSLPPSGAYMLQVIDCTETVSTNGSDMFGLKLAIIQHDRYVYDFLVFNPNSFWVIADFCRSSGLELPEKAMDIDIYPNDCMLRVCYAKLVHEVGKDGKTRLSVARYITRRQALGINPALAQISAPENAPPPKKLQKAVGPLAVTTTSQDTEVDQDDTPF